MTVGRGLPFAGIVVVATGALLVGCTTSGPPATPSASPSPSAPGSSAASPRPASSGSPSAVSATPSPATTSPVAVSCARSYSRAGLAACITASSRVYVAVWTADLADRGIATVKAPKFVAFDAVPKNPCVDGSLGDVAVASFWCGKDNTVYVSRFAAPYWTTQYVTAAIEAKVLATDAAALGLTVTDLRKGSPLTGAATEYAHELGHWVQESSGEMAWYQKRIDSTNFEVSNAYKLASELSADCMAGWAQARTAARGTWRQTELDVWAQRATMAELGADLTGLKAGFVFPKEKLDGMIAYGGPYTRLRFYDIGYAAGHGGRAGLATCARAAATFTKTTVPPKA